MSLFSPPTRAPTDLVLTNYLTNYDDLLLFILDTPYQSPGLFVVDAVNTELHLGPVRAFPNNTQTPLVDAAPRDPQAPRDRNHPALVFEIFDFCDHLVVLAAQLEFRHVVRARRPVKRRKRLCCKNSY